MSDLAVIHCVADMHRASGGTASVISALVQATARLAAHNTVVTARDGSEGDDLLRPNTHPRVAVAYVEGGSGRPWTVTQHFVDAITAQVERHDQVVIHNHGLWLPANHAAAVVARRTGVPLVISLHGMLKPWARHYRRFKKMIAWELFQKRDIRTAQSVHVSSQMEADEFEELGLSVSTQVIPFGVDGPPPVSTPMSRGKVLLFVGRIHPVKGLLTLVAAWSRARPDGWRVVIVGPDNDHKAAVRQAATEGGVIEDFVFRGPVYGDAKWELYRSASAFVLPSFTENFGAVVAEALACELPVITTTGTTNIRARVRRSLESSRTKRAAIHQVGLMAPPWLPQRPLPGQTHRSGRQESPVTQHR